MRFKVDSEILRNLHDIGITDEDGNLLDISLCFL